MSWIKKGSWVITKKETLIPVSFKSQIITQAAGIPNLKASWYQAGYFIQSISIPPIGLVRIEDKINVPTKESSLFIPKIFKPNYQLKFYKPDWISQLTLTIYEDSMGLNTAVDSIVFPNQNATAATAAAIAITATSIVLLAVNPNRKGYVIENNSNQDMFFDVAATCSVAAHMLKIPKVTAGGGISSYEGDGYTGVISGIAAAPGAGAWNIREFV
jgi:hypothetical protein